MLINFMKYGFHATHTYMCVELTITSIILYILKVVNGHNRKRSISLQKKVDGITWVSMEDSEQELFHA